MFHNLLPNKNIHILQKKKKNIFYNLRYLSTYVSRFLITFSRYILSSLFYSVLLKKDTVVCLKMGRTL